MVGQRAPRQMARRAQSRNKRDRTERVRWKSPGKMISVQTGQEWKGQRREPSMTRRRRRRRSRAETKAELQHLLSMDSLTLESLIYKRDCSLSWGWMDYSTQSTSQSVQDKVRTQCGGGDGFSPQVIPNSYDPMDWSSVQGISQARILEWVALSFSRGSSWPRDWTHISCTTGSLLHCRWVLYRLSCLRNPYAFNRCFQIDYGHKIGD